MSFGTIPTVATTSADALAAVADDYASSAPSAEVSLRWTDAPGNNVTYLDIILNLRVGYYPVHAYATSSDDLTCVHYVITPLIERTPGNLRHSELRRFAVEAEWHYHDTSQPVRRYFFNRIPEPADEQQILNSLTEHNAGE